MSDLQTGSAFIDLLCAITGFAQDSEEARQADASCALPPVLHHTLAPAALGPGQSMLTQTILTHTYDMLTQAFNHYVTCT